VIAIDPGTDERAWSATLRLCENPRLTGYDAAYLERAQRRQLSLATLGWRTDPRGAGRERTAGGYAVKGSRMLIR